MENGTNIAIVCGSIFGVIILGGVFYCLARHFCKKTKKDDVEVNAEETLSNNDDSNRRIITRSSYWSSEDETNYQTEIIPEFYPQVHSTGYGVDRSDTQIISPSAIHKRQDSKTSIRGIRNTSYESDEPYLEVRNGIYVICKNGTLYDPQSLPWSKQPSVQIKPNDTLRTPTYAEIVKTVPTKVYKPVFTQKQPQQHEKKVVTPKKPKPVNHNSVKKIPPLLNFHPISEEFCVILIAVDATPEGVGGYCVNLMERSCETYYLKTHQMPWSLQRPNDSSEFEMKNLMFALMLWQNEILRNRLFKIYTDNTAINSHTNKFGFVASKLLKHYDDCIGFNVRRINQNAFCDSGRNWSEFMKYIQPADHLSRGHQDLAEQLIHSYYKIEYTDFKRSHKPGDRNQINSEFQEKANAAVDQWKKRCDTCGYSYRLGALKKIGPRGQIEKTKTYNSSHPHRR